MGLTTSTPAASFVDKPLLEELAAPPGWTAALLRQTLPVDDDVARLAYREAVEHLLSVLPPFAEVRSEEVFLLFGAMRPEVEIKLLQQHARGWMPQFGMGVWMHQMPPETWTREEFEAAEPGTLRPVVERVLRVQPDPGAQRSAWQMLLGSGALLRISAGAPKVFVQDSTELLQPTIADVSLTSFPFYVPLLRADQLLTPAPVYDLPMADQLPSVDAYLRESVDDGGLLVLLRQAPDTFWAGIEKQLPLLQVARTTRLLS